MLNPLSCRFAVLLTVLSVTVTAQQPVQTPDPLALINASVVDVRTGRISRNVTVVARDGKITSIGPSAPPGLRSLDLRGRYLVPGLIDAHTHLSSFRTARTALESGVTTARSAGVSGYTDVGLRDLVRKGALPGPDLLAAGYHVRPQMAEEFFLTDPAGSGLMAGVTTADRIRELVRTQLSHGVDVIKIVATERAGTPETDPRKQVYSEAQLRAAVEEAATRNVPVLAHAHGDEGAAAAVRAGVRSIEHGTYLSDATLALMKERGTFFVPTYMVVIDVRDPGGDYDVPALQIRGAHMLPRLEDAIRRAHKAGVRIVAGTDTGYGPNSVVRLAQEVAAFARLGLSPLESLQTATTTAAELLRIEKSTGAIEPGLEADLIAVDRNPLEDIGALADALLVVSNGHVALNRLEFGREEGKK